MADLKIMFWNINNTYAYKVHALKTDDDSNTKDEANSDTDPKTESDSKNKDDAQQIVGLFRSRNRKNRQKISDVIKKIDPDIAVLVEYSVGQYTLLTADDEGEAKPSAGDDNPTTSANAEDPGASQNPGDENPDSNSKNDEPKPVQVFDRFGPYIYRNNLSHNSSQQRWDAQLMAVDCSDISDNKEDEQDPAKQPFELYCILWKKSKVKPVSRLSAEYQGKEQPLLFHPRYPAGIIFTLKNQPQTKFTLITFHAPHIKKDEAQAPDDENSTSTTAAQGSKPQENSNFEDDERITALKNLSQLKRIDDAVHSSRKIPVVIAGNFELDYDKEKFKPLLELGFQTCIDGKTEFAKKAKGENQEPAPNDEGEANSDPGQEEDTGQNNNTSKKDEVDKFELTSACDNIFIANFEETKGQEGATQEEPAAIYNFVKEDCENDVDQALTLSNHLPIYVTVRLK